MSENLEIASGNAAEESSVNIAKLFARKYGTIYFFKLYYIQMQYM